ncbi:hypothetical protein K2W90_01140 [Candidatus Babeliales bacterium]|nr:hypothetical protein [Candidatus Babeliales bacterium]
MIFSKHLHRTTLFILITAAISSQLGALDVIPRASITTASAQNAVNKIVDEVGVALDKCRSGYPMVKTATQRDATMFFLGYFINNGPGLPKGTQQPESKKITRAKNIAGQIKTLIESYNTSLQSSSVTANQTRTIEQSATNGQLRSLTNKFNNLIAEMAPSQGW